MTPKKKLFILGGFVLLSWFVHTIVLHQIEGWSYFDSLYFSIITTATIGYGDLVPLTVTGKLITMTYAIIYVPLFLYIMSVFFAWEIHRLAGSEDRTLKKRMNKILINQEEILTKTDVGAVLDDGEKKSVPAIQKKPLRKKVSVNNG